MAAQPQQTLTATNANSKHSSLLTTGSSSSSSSSSSPSTTLPSPRLAHYHGGRLGCSSELDGRGGGLGGHTATIPPVSHPNFSSSSYAAHPSSSSSFLSSSAPGVPFVFSPLSTSSSSSSASPSSHSQTPRPVSRRTRPCSLCGTKALSPQPTYLSTPAFGVLEQPIVLLHRLEDGLPRGDLKSLHAFGMIRLLPVQSAAKGCVVSAPDVSNGENAGYDAGESRIRQAMEDATQGCTQGVLYDHGSTFERKKNATCSDGETNSERLEESDGETGVESVFLEESYPLEAIVDTEVAVVSNHSDKGDKLLIKENNCVKTPVVSSWRISDSKCSDAHHVRADKVKSVRDQGSDGNKDKLPYINHNSMNAVFRYQDSESEKRLVRHCSAVEAESDSPFLLQSCDRIKENSSPSDNQLLSAKDFSVPSTKCPSTLLTNCVSTTSVKALPGFTSPSCIVAPSCKQTTLTTKAFAYQCSSSVVQRTPDSFIAYSPKMRHSPMSWSPHTASPNVCESPVLISNSCTSPEISASPIPSPPSPCESPSLPFSPPPSPAAPEFIQSDSVDALGKGESQSFPLSPYSPGSSPSSPISPISPAAPLSPCDSPPSPCASANSPHTLLEEEEEEERPSALLEQNDVMEDASSETVGHPCTPSESGDNCTASQHSLMISHSSEVNSETNSQVEYQLGVTDELKPTQISSLESTDSIDSLGQSEDFACDGRETDIKSHLDSCSSSNEDDKPVNAESDLNHGKLKVRIRSKTETRLPTEKFSSDSCNKNGIPKIVLTLRGNGPNKEYSCSNKVRNDGQSSSKVHVMHRKHKSKKDKKERERHKVRKMPKGNKYKRHLELFGEDSNDSLELERCDNSGIASRCDDSLRGPEKSKDAESPLVFSVPGESVDNSEDSFVWPIPRPGYCYSENVERVCEKVKQPSPEKKHVQEDSFSDYLPDLDPVPSPGDNDGVLRIPKTPLVAKDEVFRGKTQVFTKKEIKFQRGRVRGRVLAKKRLLLSKKKQGRSFLRNWHSKQVSKCLRIKQKSKIKKEAEEDHTTSDCSLEVTHSKVLGEDLSPLEKASTLSNAEKNTCESVPTTPSVTVQETVSVSTDNPAKETVEQKISDISSVVKKESVSEGRNEHSSQEKVELSYLRARPERTTKKCETGQDSDSCLWVSFGVNRPVPVPASDLPSLEPETEVRETVKLEYGHSEGKRKIHDITPTPKPQTTSVSIPQVVDCKTVADKLAGATSPLDVKNSSATPGNSLSLPSSDLETTPSLDEELSWNKAKYSKQDGIIANNIVEGGQSGETGENIPDLPPGNFAVKTNIVKPHIRLRSAPRSTGKVMEQPRGNQQSTNNPSRCTTVSKASVSRDIGDTNPKLENCSLSQSFFLSSGGPGSGDIKQDKLKHFDIAAEDSMKTTPSESEVEDSQYYRPKKIQKVVDENVPKVQLDALYPEARDSEKTSDDNNCLRFTEETVTHSSAEKGSSCEDERDLHDEVIRPAAEMNANEYSASRNEKETLEAVPDNGDRGNLPNVDGIEQSANVIIPPPHDPEFDKVWADRRRKKRKPRCRKQSAKFATREGCESVLAETSGETPSEESSAPCKDTVAPKGVTASTKQNKEATKKKRKSRKRDESGSGARVTSAFEAIQQTLEVKSVEERGRRLAQEFKDFNWLEEKIKNSSLNHNVSSSAPSPSTAKRPPPPLLSQSHSLPATLPLQSPTPLSPSNPLKRKDEPPSRRNSFTGCSATGGLKGHLQTAVPPLLPSYRVTALPKRSRLSPPCSSVFLGGGGVVMSTAASSNNSVLTQETPSTSMGVSYGPEPITGTAAATLQETVASLHSLPDSDRATLYSSTDSNTATLYGVANPQLEVLFEDAETASNSLYRKNLDPTLQNIAVSFPPLPLARASQVTYPYSLTTSALAKGGHGISTRDRQCSTVVSNSNPRVSTGHPTSSGASVSASLPSSNISQMAGFIQMPEPVTSTSMPAAFINTPGSNSTTREDITSNALETGSGSPQPTSSTSPSPIPVFSQKHILLKRAFMDMMKDTENVPESRSPSLEADVKISPKDVMQEEKSLKDVGPEEGSEDHRLKRTTTNDVDMDSKDTPNQEEKVGELSKIVENSVKKDEEEKVINALSADVKQTLLKSTTKSESSESDTKSSSEMHPAILFSMLYEELQRTRQEVERLRKQQEMMLTEKSEKSEEKIVKNELPVKEETVPKDTPQSQNSSSVGFQSDDDSVEICEEKPAKISIRNDLLASNSQASPGDKVPVQTTQLSTIMTHGDISPKPSVSVPDRELLSPLAQKSPTLPQMSPQLCQTSPHSSQVSPLSRTSPVVNPLVSPVTHHISYPAPVQAVEVSTVQSTVPLPHTSPTPSHINVVSLYSASGSLRASPVLPRNSPVISRQSPSSSSSPAVPKSSPALPKSSPIAPLCSPRGSKDITVVDINSESLRSKYGINTEVEVMPVSASSKPQLSEPQPHAYLEVIEYQKPQDAPLLLEAVKGRRLDSNSSGSISSSCTINERQRVFPQSTLAQHLVGDHVKRTMHSQAIDSEIKRSRFSTSDLAEFPPSSQNPPPPLKPVASLQRRYSDNIDARKVEPIMVHFPTSSIPGFPSTSEHSASSLNFPQPRSSVTQNTILSPHIRRCPDGNTDRTREYQQQFNLHYQRQIGPCPPALRSLGPDKATIFPIPAPSSSSMQPYGKPHTPPTSRGSVIEQHRASMIESSSAGVFPKLKQTIQQSFDAQVAGATSQERVQPSAISFEKTRQPQTFAARVLVRDSVPETVPRLPPQPYPSQHYSNCNPHLSTVLPNHHYLNNMHHSSGTNLHHIVAGGLIRGSLQPSSTNIHSHNSNPRSNTSSGSSDRKRCLSCPQPAKFLCSGCKKAWYCSENCQREHWALHNTSCVP